MGLLRVDETKCKKDGFCVKDCAANIIRLGDDGGYPEILAGAESLCLVCGHCVAVCPHHALSHESVRIEDSPAIREELRISEEQAIQFLRSRRSVRHYHDRPVEREKIERLIEIARYAPTGANTQSVEWLVLTDKSKLNTIARLTVDWFRQVIDADPVAATNPHLTRVVTRWDEGYDSVLRNAPAVIVALAPAEAMNGLVDLTLALSYLDVIAPTMGLGTCWAGLLHAALLGSPLLRESVGIPVGYPHQYPIMLGYSKVKFHRLPERKPPKITFA
jgi:nitroreductase/NAD-dependent dihydropyrimidine dehydrogenase PreA subunit